MIVRRSDRNFSGCVSSHDTFLANSIWTMTHTEQETMKLKSTKELQFKLLGMPLAVLETSRTEVCSILRWVPVGSTNEYWLRVLPARMELMTHDEFVWYLGLYSSWYYDATRFVAGFNHPTHRFLKCFWMKNNNYFHKNLYRIHSHNNRNSQLLIFARCDNLDYRDPFHLKSGTGTSISFLNFRYGLTYHTLLNIFTHIC